MSACYVMLASLSRTLLQSFSQQAYAAETASTVIKAGRRTRPLAAVRRALSPSGATTWPEKPQGKSEPEKRCSSLRSESSVSQSTCLFLVLKAPVSFVQHLRQKFHLVGVTLFGEAQGFAEPVERESNRAGE